MATLKISDLSVGDWVHHDFYEADMHVVTIYGDNERVIAESSSGHGVTCHLDHFTPIPITAEILEKNGFESSSSYWSIYKDNGDYIEIWRDGDKWYLSVNSVEYILCGLHWVHQIQHLMRVWEFDKEINL